MATSYLFGVSAGQLTLRPGMTLAQDDKGMWTGRAEFTCLTGDFGTTSIQLALRKGTSLNQVSDTVGAEFSFLAVDTMTARDEPGGYTVVEVTYKGFNDEQWEFDADRTKVYTRNTSIQEKTILQHPVVKDFTWTYLQALRMGMDGKWTERADSTDSDLKLMAQGDPNKAIVFSSTDTNFIPWWKSAVSRKQHTIKCAITEWTVSTTGKAKLADAELAQMGKVVDAADVDGTPATPPGEKWMMTGVTENIQITGEGSNSWSKTWTSSGPGGFDELAYGEATP
jgi:hypothetical protein